MNQQQILKSLKDRLNARYGYTEAITKNQADDIDYPKVTSEIKSLESDIATGEATLSQMREKLKSEITEAGEKARKAAKGSDLQLQMANRKLSDAIIRLGDTLMQDEQYRNLANELTEKDKHYRNLLVQRETFETQNADVIEQLRRERIKKQLEQAEV